MAMRLKEGQEKDDGKKKQNSDKRSNKKNECSGMVCGVLCVYCYLDLGSLF
jgi:hypothetical protein